jgi:outer membrane protein
MTRICVLRSAAVVVCGVAVCVVAQPESNAILEAEAAIVARAQTTQPVTETEVETPVDTADLPISGADTEVLKDEAQLEAVESTWPSPETDEDDLPPPPMQTEREKLVPSMFDDDMAGADDLPPPPVQTEREALVPSMLDDDLPAARTPLPGDTPAARPLTPSPADQTVTAKTSQVDTSALTAGAPGTGRSSRTSRDSTLPDIGSNVLSRITSRVDEFGVFQSNVLVTVRECIVIGLERNLGLTIDRYDSHTSYEDIRLQRSVFDPQFDMSFMWSGAQSPYFRYLTLPNGEEHRRVGNSKRDRLDLEGSISGKFITGMEYTFGMGQGRTRTGSSGDRVDPAFDTYAGGGITVPLLKGFGMGVNLAPIRIARNNWRIARIELEASIQQLITGIVRSYFVLYALYEDVNSKEYTLQIAYDLLAINEAKVAVGMAAPLEVTQAKARIATQEEQLLVSRNAIDDAEDNLRRIINYEMANVLRPRALQPIEYHLIPIEKPEVAAFTETESESIETALKYRQSLRIANITLRNADETVKVAKNNLLPELNLLGGLEYSGIGDDYDGAYDEQYEGTHPNWSLGVELSFPLLYNEPVATYRKARYSREQAQLGIIDEQHTVAMEVRSALRAVETNLKRIEATRESSRLAREQLRAEQQKFDVGQSTTFLVFEFQEQLATAFSSEILALTQWRISVAQFYEVVGRSLQRNGVVIDDYYENPYTSEPRIAEFLWQ